MADYWLQVTIRGNGFSMDEEDVVINLSGSRCVVVSSTLEEIICVTDPAVQPAAFTCETGAGVTECATCASPLTKDDECATCNGGAELSGGACWEIPTVTIMVEDDASSVENHGMVSTASEGGTFWSDEGLGKGDRWAIFSGAIAVSGTYEVRLAVPPATLCTPVNQVSEIIFDQL
jgi:hypothetical protein